MGGSDRPAATGSGANQIYEKFNPLLHGGVTTTSGKGAKKQKTVLSIAFVKKYIQYAKATQPILTPQASEHIVSVYAGLRNDDLASNQKRVSGFLTFDLRVGLTVVYRPHL